MDARKSAQALWSSYREFDLPGYFADRRSKGSFETRLAELCAEWFKPKRFLISVATLLAVIALVLVLLVTGTLGSFYDWLVGWSSNDRPWTDIMRDNPQIFWISAPLLLIVLFWLVPRKAFGRLWIVSAAFLVGFLGGHVFS